MKRPIATTLAVFVLGIAVGRFVLDDESPVWAGVDDLPQDCVPGDSNGDGRFNVADPIYSLQFLFGDGAPPISCDATVAFIVRHGERDGLELNEEGHARAAHLAELFESFHLDALIASDKVRTQQTLDPLLAAKPNLGELIITDDTGAAAAEALRALPVGSRVVVAHHSYTIGRILKDLGAVEDSFSVPTNQYDNVWVVSFRPGRDAESVKLRYCVAPDCPVVEPPPQ